MGSRRANGIRVLVTALSTQHQLLHEKRLAEDGARPIIFYPVSGACWQPQFKGHQMMVNGNYNGWRLEDAWRDK